MHCEGSQATANAVFYCFSLFFFFLFLLLLHFTSWLTKVALPGYGYSGQKTHKYSVLLSNVMFSVFNFLSCNGEQLSVLPRHLKNCLCSSSISNCPRTMMMHVTGMVDCFRCVCILKTHRQSTLCFTTHVYLCSCIILCYFTGIIHTVVRQISNLLIDNKESVFCILPFA